MNPLAVDNSKMSPVATESRLQVRLSIGRRIEYWAVLGALKLLGTVPHRVARGGCAVLAFLSYWLWPRLRRVGLFNLSLAFPQWSERRRRRALFGLFRNFGRMLADFAHFPSWNRQNIERVIIYDGFENYARAHEQGKGVLILTAHFSIRTVRLPTAFTGIR
jgi:KDO2-lipid IV(A) lauroyltransferase